MEARGRELHRREKSERQPVAFSFQLSAENQTQQIAGMPHELFAQKNSECCSMRIDRGLFWLMADSSAKKKPTGCLLGACSGQHPMGYRFSLLTLLFSGVFAMIKPQNGAKFRLIL